MRSLRSFFLILILQLLVQKCDSLFKLTNIKCTSFDKAFCDFTRCELKVLGRGKIGLFLYAKVHQLPVKEVLINLNLFRWFNGYRPFMYNVTVDFCNYMRHPKRYPWFNILYETMVQFSNLNHSCPYNHDIIVSNMILKDEMLRRAPFPTGAYMVQVTVGNPAWKGVAQVMLEIVENDLQKPLKNQTNKRS